MDAFAYLSVLLSIIIGLAIAQVLQGYRALLLARGRIHADAAPLIWSGLVLLFATQLWWSSFGLNARAHWHFLDFAAILVQTGLLYMLSAIILPDVPAEHPVDLRSHFERHRVAFFLFLIAMLASSFAKELVLEHRFLQPVNLAFHVVLAAASLVGIFFGGRRIQLALALFAVASFLIYVFALFSQL